MQYAQVSICLFGSKQYALFSSVWFLISACAAEPFPLLAASRKSEKQQRVYGWCTKTKGDTSVAILYHFLHILYCISITKENFHTSKSNYMSDKT
jgi:hypothetical protein